MPTILLCKRFRRELENVVIMFIVMLPTVGLLLLEGHYQKPPVAVLGILMLAVTASVLKSSMNELKIIDAHTIEKSWRFYAFNFKKVRVHKTDVIKLRIDQLKTKHYALIMEIKGMKDIILFDTITKNQFKERMNHFNAQTADIPFFLGLETQVLQDLQS